VYCSGNTSKSKVEIQQRVICSAGKEKPPQLRAGAFNSGLAGSLIFLLALVQVAIVLDAGNAQARHARTVDRTLP
jgi:hypothetical protein